LLSLVDAGLPPSPAFSSSLGSLSVGQRGRAAKVAARGRGSTTGVRREEGGGLPAAEDGSTAGVRRHGGVSPRFLLDGVVDRASLTRQDAAVVKAGARKLERGRAQAGPKAGAASRRRRGGGVAGWRVTGGGGERRGPRGRRGARGWAGRRDAASRRRDTWREVGSGAAAPLREGGDEKWGTRAWKHGCHK
jgi:hypothetical protein